MGATLGPTSGSKSVTSQGRDGLWTRSADLEGSLWVGRGWEGSVGFPTSDLGGGEDGVEARTGAS